MPKRIADIKDEFDRSSPYDWEKLFLEYGDDERAGVKKLIAVCRRKIAAQEQEQRRLYAMREFERRYGGECSCICGVDEAGRGPLAGPVVAGAVILPKDCEILYLNDSKKLSAKK